MIRTLSPVYCNFDWLPGRFSPPTGTLSTSEEYPTLAVVKETITAKWSGEGEQVKFWVVLAVHQAWFRASRLDFVCGLRWLDNRVVFSGTSVGIQ